MKLQTIVKSTPVMAVLLVTFVVFSAASAGAQTSSHSKKKAYKATSQDTVESTAAAPEATSTSYGRSNIKYGLGFSSSYNLTSSNASLTGWIGLTPAFGLQPLLAIGSTSPFNFAVGTLAKYTVAQQGNGGFHLGGGISMGSVHAGATNGGLLFGNTGATGNKSGFAMGLSALAGIHYELPNTSIMFHFDGGANFGVVDGDTDFNLGSIGPLLGASVIYMF